MISLSKLSQITNLKERVIQFPSDNEFTQNTAFQIQLKELEAQNQKNSEIQDLSQYTNMGNTDIIDENDIVSQQTIISSSQNFVEVSELEDVQSTYKSNNDCILIYGEHEVIGIPELIKLIFFSSLEASLSSTIFVTLSSLSTITLP